MGVECLSLVAQDVSAKPSKEKIGSALLQAIKEIENDETPEAIQVEELPHPAGGTNAQLAPSGSEDHESDPPSSSSSSSSNSDSDSGKAGSKEKAPDPKAKAKAKVKAKAKPKAVAEPKQQSTASKPTPASASVSGSVQDSGPPAKRGPKLLEISVLVAQSSIELELCHNLVRAGFCQLKFGLRLSISLRDILGPNLKIKRNLQDLNLGGGQTYGDYLKDKEDDERRKGESAASAVSKRRRK